MKMDLAMCLVIMCMTLQHTGIEANCKVDRSLLICEHGIYHPSALGLNMGLRCDAGGLPHLFNCGVGSVWDQAQLKCTTTKLHSSGPAYAEPCRRADVWNGRRLEAGRRPDQYVLCDDRGFPYVRRCQRGHVWSQGNLTCVNDAVITTTQVPVTDKCSLGQYHPLPFHIRYYVTCTHGTAFSMPCSVGTRWNPELSNCLPPSQHSDLAPFSPPCTSEAMTRSGFYFRSSRGSQYLIQCDLEGYQTLLRCPNNKYWDDVLKTCRQ